MTRTKSSLLYFAAALGLGWMLTLPPAAVEAQTAGSAPVKTLRGDVAADELNPAPEQRQVATPQGGFDRAYRQAPPLVPHRTDTYQITPASNACMTCHDWPNNTKHGAPKISETHYTDRNGVRLDRVAGTRYFCTACHVPQVNAKELVRNDFQNATTIK